jgi:membrane associated rhomboid family serine protease
MIPLRDVIPSRTTPYVTISLVVINVLVFLYQLSLGEYVNEFVFSYGLVPAFFSWPSVVTSMFLHGGFLHVAGNMLYLWIFGDNIEDRIGSAKFLAFYLICGLAASVAHILFGPDSVIPSLGASGAIAGVLGAYLVLFPRRSVKVLMARQIVNMPAFMVLGLWILLQVFAQISVVGGSAGGVAYMAHIGGFVAGLALIFIFGKRAPSIGQVPR